MVVLRSIGYKMKFNIIVCVIGNIPIAMLLVPVYLILLFPLIVVSSPSVFFISLCVAFVALVFMPGLYPTAYRATFPAFLCGCL